MEAYVAVSAERVAEKRACVEEHLKVEAFEAWLDTLADDDVVGKSQAEYACPLHNYFDAVCGINVRVYSETSSFATERRVTDRFGYRVMVREDFENPPWASKFIEMVDSHGQHCAIKAKEAKELMRRAVEGLGNKPQEAA